MRPVIIALLSVFISVSSIAQWQWSNPQPSGYFNGDIVSLDANTLLIVNYNGELIRTIDRGTSWKIDPKIQDGRCIHYKDSIIILGGKSGKILISEDLGKTWSDKSIVVTNHVDRVQAISRDTLIAVTGVRDSRTKLYKSVDRGSHWQMITSDTLIVKSIDFIDSKIGFLSSYYGVYKTIDGGNSWRQVFGDSSSAQVRYVKFANLNFGLAYKENNGIFKTTDGGATWTLSNSNGLGIYAIQYSPSGIIYAGGEYGVFWKSQDQGASWQDLSGFFRDGIYGLSFLDDNTGFACGAYGQIAKTTNAGINWTEYSQVYTDIWDVHFPTPDVGYAGTFRKIVKTVDSGHHWILLSDLPFNTIYENIKQIHFYTRDTGVVLTDRPAGLYKTYNGGTTWKSIPIPGNNSISYMQGLSVVGSTSYLSLEQTSPNYILKSIDSCETWRVQKADYNAGFQKICFTDPATGYAFGGAISVHKTTDSGKTWRRVLTEPETIFYTLHFVSPTTGYAGGSSGYLYKTVDSGNTWTRQMITPGNWNFTDIYQLKFFNERFGYFNTEYGQVYRTIDSGATWTYHAATPYEVLTIETTPDSSIYFAGRNGMILKRGLQEYRLDSLKADSLSACAGRFSIKIMSFLSKVDSIWFQFGVGSYTNSISATPFSIRDTLLRVYAYPSNLTQGVTYKLRAKIFYQGYYYYSDEIIFNTVGLPAPQITFNNGTLRSSATAGNQWYLNSTAIPGATQQTYTPTVAGSYSVISTIAGCVSPPSQPFQFVPTAINDPVLQASLNIFPNPVRRTLYILNPQNKKLAIDIYSIEGIRVIHEITTSRNNGISLQALSAGVYILSVQDMITRKEIKKSIVKM